MQNDSKTKKPYKKPQIKAIELGVQEVMVGCNSYNRWQLGCSNPNIDMTVKPPNGHDLIGFG